MKVFETIQKHYRKRDLAAREWKKKGGRVVGYFCDNVPEELILASGFFPFRLSGDPWGDTEQTDKYMEPYYEGFVRSSLDILLKGEYDFLDYLVIPRARDSISQQYAHLHEIKSLNPSIKLPELYRFEYITATRTYSSSVYNLDRIRDFKTKLEEWSGKRITKNALSAAINLTNENKTLLKKVAALRSADPPRLSGTEALQIIGSSMFMLKEEHNKLLAQFLEGTDRLPARNGVRLFVEGSPLDNLQLYEIIESCGATVVGEDNCWGNRYADVPIDTSLDHLEAIADRYQNKSPCPYVTFPEGLRAEYCRSKALEAGAQGVIFFILEWDPAQTWDYPVQNETLKRESIPTACFMHQKYLLSEPELLKVDIEKFIQSLHKQNDEQ